MVKQRMSAADVAAAASCLRKRVLGMRVANIYDVNAKTYLLKLARSGEEGEKVFLLMESGLRFHSTKVLRDKSNAPSNFTLKLRKHLRTRRLDDVRQLGVDRLVDFCFGSGPNCHHLLLELYAQGNIILTDSKYEILTLLRSHRDDDKGVAIMSRHPYPIRTIRPRAALPPQALTSALASADEKATLKVLVTSVIPQGPNLAEHCILLAKLDAKRKPKAQPLSDAEAAALLHSVHAMQTWFEERDDLEPPGYIFYKIKEQAAAARLTDEQNGGSEPEDRAYEDYEPMIMQQHSERLHLTFPTFDEAMDEFYSKVAVQQATRARETQERQVVTKLDRVRIDQERRVDALAKEAEGAELRASLLEYNAQAVDEAINAVRQALARGLSWKELKALIKAERDAGNPVAALVHSLQLEANRVTLILSNLLDEEEEGGDDDALTRPATLVEVDLDMNAFANARRHFEQRRVHATKQAKTLAANSKALQAAEKKAEQQLAQAKKVTVPTALRKPFWFERFHWFVTSENVLVLSGRDPQQSELLVKRHFAEGDLYVHADLQGASATIVKAPPSGQGVGPVSLAQAGCGCLCRSQAWDAKIVTSAWWVHHHQVSKNSSAGDAMPVGEFMITGKKNFLPPVPLIMGFTFLFQLDDSCLAAHAGERAPRAAAVEAEAGAASASHHDKSSAAVSASPSESALADEFARGAGRPSRSSALEAFLEGAADPYARRTTDSSAKYGLEDSAAPSQRDPAAEEPNGNPDDAAKPRRHMSAAVRKRLKQGRAETSPATGSQELDAASTAHSQAELPAPGAPQQQLEQFASRSEQPAQAQVQLSRGQKARARRAKEKYADQDEDDRNLALQVLGSAGQHKSKKDKREARKAARKANADAETEAKGLLRPATEEELAAARVRPRDALPASRFRAAQPEHRPPDGTAAPAVQQRQDGSEAAATEPLPDAEGDESSAPAQAAVSEEAQDEASGSSDGGSEEGADGPGSTSGHEQDADGTGEGEARDAEAASGTPPEGVAGADRERLTALDTWTGSPHAGDVLLHALPMAAPYSALQGYKFRVKVTPGNQRKGKAARQALELLCRSQDVQPAEKELMRTAPDTEAIDAMLGNVKLSMPGLQSLQIQARKAKKGR
ncbi:hypothetical protein WJX73_010610 [Symbiochloris irregularis]|uniref:Nuclear export mediator factor Nemf n=1 Tax=Symbiochloris irregularis TaxID=706552 RepID=A0AAW1NWG8_9CHLO